MSARLHTRMLEATRPEQWPVIPRLEPITTQVRQPNEKLIAILLKPGTLTPEEWAYVEECEREEIVP